MKKTQLIVSGGIQSPDICEKATGRVIARCVKGNPRYFIMWPGEYLSPEFLQGSIVVFKPVRRKDIISAFLAAVPNLDDILRRLDHPNVISVPSLDDLLNNPRPHTLVFERQANGRYGVKKYHGIMKGFNTFYRTHEQPETPELIEVIAD